MAPYLDEVSAYRDDLGVCNIYNVINLRRAAYNMKYEELGDWHASPQ